MKNHQKSIKIEKVTAFESRRDKKTQKKKKNKPPNAIKAGS